MAATANNLFYVTGFFGDGVGAVYPDKTVVVTSRLEELRVSETGHEVELVVVDSGREVGARASKAVKGSAVVDDDRRLPGAQMEMNPDLFLEARRVKDQTEVARIAKASSGIDRIFETLEQEVKVGMTEWQAAAVVMRVATERGLTPNGFDGTLSPTIVASGPNGARPHSELTTRKIRKGDAVIADISFRYEGYNSDATRTFLVGTVKPEVKRSYAVVREAQAESLEAMAAGEGLSRVAEIAVGVLRRHGLDKYLNHSIGHGVGIDIHERPRVAVGSPGWLEKDEVVTDEPGVYFKGKYGVRIEDTVRIGAKPVPLTRYTRDMVTVG